VAGEPVITLKKAVDFAQLLTDITDYKIEKTTTKTKIRRGVGWGGGVARKIERLNMQSTGGDDVLSERVCV
jgi:hypothetical protein